jgi:citrate synthase
MEESCAPPLNTGLRGVTVASTRISLVDGKAGKLVYRGYLIKDLAEQGASFEEIVHLLLFEKLPTADELAALKRELESLRALPAGLIAALKACPSAALPMDVLQAGVSLLAQHDPEAADPSRPAATRKALRLIAQLPTLVAAWHRIRSGQEPIPPLGQLGHAANFLYMLSGTPPDEQVAHFMDTALVLHAEHAFNASTFAARQVASTRAHLYAAVSAGVGALSGELHGGANVRVMEMLQAIGQVENVEAYVQRQLDAGKLIYGLGHAVYKVDDPRAGILAPMSYSMGQRTGQGHWYEISKRLEERGKAIFKARKGIDIFVNVDFYSASLYYTMGIPTDLFSPVFAIARIAGWSAHVIEEQFAEAAAKPELYRPESTYIGEYCGPDECAWVPIQRRS